MIPALSLVCSAPAGFVDRPPPLTPRSITDIRTESDRIVWTYTEPADFAGYLIRVTPVAGRSWEAATPFLISPSTFVLFSALPAGTAEVLVKPAVLLFGVLIEALNAARASVSDDGGGGGGGGSALFPGDWIRASTTPSGTNVSALTNLKSSAAGAPAGRQTVITGNINLLGGTVTLSGSGTKSNPIYLRGNVESDDPADYPVLSNGTLLLDGADRYIIRRLRLDQVDIRIKNRVKNCQIECNKINFVADGGIGYSNQYLVVAYNAECTDLLVAFNQVTVTTTFYYVEEIPVSGPADTPIPNGSLYRSKNKRHLITYNDFVNRSGGSKLLGPGNNPRDATNDLEVKFWRNLDRGGRTSVDAMELKYDGLHIYRNTFEMASLGDPQWKVRQGRLDPPNTSPDARHGDVFEENLFVQPPGTPAPRISFRGSGHRAINNACLNLTASERPSPTSKLGSGKIQFLPGYSYGKTFPEIEKEDKGENKLVAAYACVAAGNKGFTAEWDDPGAASKPYQPEAGFTPRSGPGQNTGNTLSTSNTRAWDFTTPIAGADIDTVLGRLFPDDVGPGAWDSTFRLDDDGGGGGGGGFTTAIGSDYTANYGANWIGAATVTQGTDSVRLTGGPQADHPAGARIYGRLLIGKPCRIRAVYTRKLIPVATDSNGAFGLIGLCLPNGRAPRAKPSDFPLGTPTGDDTLEDWFTGFRFSVGQINTTGAAQSNRFRCTLYVGGPRVQLTPTSTLIEIDLGLNVAQELELAFAGDTVTLQAVGLGLSQTYRDARLGAFAGGYLFFHGSSGSDAVWSNIRRIV